MVEARGVEPLSENPMIRISPSAVCVLTFPPPPSRRQDDGLSRFINPTRGKSYPGWYPAFMTPVTYAAGGLRPALTALGRESEIVRIVS